MAILFDVAYILGAYLLGSVPQLLALAKLRRVYLDGDYHMSLWQRAGLLLAVVGILLEFVKGALAVMAGRLLGFDLYIIAIAGVAAVCGQMWPIFHRFDGEKGNTIGLGMAAALTILPLLIALIPIAIGAAIRTVPRVFGIRRSSEKTPILGGPYSRSLPLGMMGGFLVLPFAAWYFDEPLGIVLSYAALFILILVRRLTAGLSRDLKMKASTSQILLGRLFYDRGISQYRTQRI